LRRFKGRMSGYTTKKEEPYSKEFTTENSI